MTNAEIIARRKRWEKFLETPIGSAFDRFERLHAMAWQKDTELAASYNGATDKRARELWAQAGLARTSLLKLLGYNEQEAPNEHPMNTE